MNTGRHIDTERTLTVEEAVAVVSDALESLVRPMSLTGTLQGLRRGRAWSRCELLAHEGATIAAKLPVAIPPHTRLLDPDRLEGAAVTITGRFEMHPLYGPLQFVAEQIAILDSVAAPVAVARQFLAELRANGLINANKALPLASRLDRIGLIAPVGGGAGGADFVDRLTVDDDDTVQLVARYVPMGGPVAPQAIGDALRSLPAAAIQAIVICRGGGAASELAVFNHPTVVESICAVPVPVIVGIGHSTDSTLADQVAHTALPTPSAAAAWLIDRRNATDRAQLMQRAKDQSEAAALAAQAAQRASAEAHDAILRAQDRTRAASIAIAAAAAIVLAVVALTILVLAG